MKPSPFKVPKLNEYAWWAEDLTPGCNHKWVTASFPNDNCSRPHVDRVCSSCTIIKREFQDEPKGLQVKVMYRYWT